MKKLATLGLVFWMFLAFFAEASAVTSVKLNHPKVPKSIAKDSGALFPIRQLKSGMRGVGYTVFSSTKGPEPFEFEVLGLMKDFLGPKRDLILARLIEPRLTKHGVVAGMSGSPTYINGKLLGAVGYGFGAFTSEPIAGITPIRDMLDARLQPLTHRHADFGQGSLKTIAMPLVSSGIPSSVQRAFADILKQKGYGAFVPSVGLVGAADAAKPERLYPGGPVAVSLIRGDLNLAGIGTTTWVKGNEFLAFGHSFLNSGFSDLPVANAEIVTTLFSQQMSMKLGQALSPIGRLTNDRLPGLVGTMGTVPKMANMNVIVDQKKYHYDVALHGTDTPMFATFAFANALTNRTDRDAGGAYKVSAKLKLEDGRQTQFEHHISNFGIPLEADAAARFFRVLDILLNQNLEKVRLDKLDIQVRYSPETANLNLENVQVSKSLIPAKPYVAQIRLKPFRKKAVFKSIPIKIPRGTAVGEYQIVFADSFSALDIELKSNIWTQPQDYDMLLSQFSRLPKDSEVCIYLKKSSESKRVEGHSTVSLPPSFRRIFSNTFVRQEDALQSWAVRLSCYDFEQPVFGLVIGNVTIRND